MEQRGRLSHPAGSLQHPLSPAFLHQCVRTVPRGVALSAQQHLGGSEVLHSAESSGLLEYEQVVF